MTEDNIKRIPNAWSNLPKEDLMKVWHCRVNIYLPFTENPCVETPYSPGAEDEVITFNPSHPSTFSHPIYFDHTPFDFE